MPYRIIPSPNGTFRIETDIRTLNPRRALDHSYELERKKKYDEACYARFDVATVLAASLMEKKGPEFDFSDDTTYAAAELLYDSSIDLLLVGQYEVSAAMLELLLECDSEDRMESTVPVTLCYIALGDKDCFEDTIDDIDSRSVDYALLRLIENYREEGIVSTDDVERLLKHREMVEEILLEEHPTDDAYQADIRSEHPSLKARTRATYLRYEPLIRMFKGLEKELRNDLSEHR